MVVEILGRYKHKFLYSHSTVARSTFTRLSTKGNPEDVSMERMELAYDRLHGMYDKIFSQYQKDLDSLNRQLGKMMTKV